MSGDPLPERLFKFFSNREHAEAFALTGRIRLGSNKYFAATEDQTRGDKSEGEARLKIPSNNVPQMSVTTGAVSYKPGVFDFSGTNLNPTYLFCMAAPDADLKALSEKWPFVVEITNPAAFAVDFEESIRCSPPAGHLITGVDAAKVIYNKGALSQVPTPEERYRLAYAQKPDSFVKEGEFRFVVKLDIIQESTKDEFIEIRLSHHTEYTRILDGGIA